jgi:hypothetical protein
LFSGDAWGSAGTGHTNGAPIFTVHGSGQKGTDR